MKSSILKAIDFDYCLLEFYKKLYLNENDVIVLLMIKHLLEQNNTLITADLLAIKMNLARNDIDDILVSLLRKKYISFEQSEKGTVTSLEPLIVKMVQLYQEESVKNDDRKKDDNAINSIKNIYEVFEKELARTLSPVEYSLIEDWVNNGISEQVCIDALHEAIKNKKTSLKAVDKILLRYQAREDLEKEGHTPINNNWDKSLDKTLNIAKKNNETED